MKNVIITLLVLALVGIGYYAFLQNRGGDTQTQENMPGTEQSAIPQATPTATSTSAVDKASIGSSAGGKDIYAYTYGTGERKLLFVGGIHGGYEWNTSAVAYQLMEYLESHPAVIPSNLKIAVIPVVNPDGLAKVVSKEGSFGTADVNPSKDLQVAGRYNSNKVDLNRNFDCNWQKSGKWQSTTVSGGTAAFSEPESKAVKSFVESYAPNAIVTWYSSAGGVYSSNCNGGILPETVKINELYAKASGYPSHEKFDSYEVTGDMVDWFAKMKIPAISVLLSTHDSVEWDNNLAGIAAVIQHFAK